MCSQLKHINIAEQLPDTSVNVPNKANHDTTSGSLFFFFPSQENEKVDEKYMSEKTPLRDPPFPGTARSLHKAAFTSGKHLPFSHPTQSVSREVGGGRRPEVGVGVGLKAQAPARGGGVGVMRPGQPQGS
ncbi:hypothetical protein CapIbe_001806 [Capra ibex]